MIDRTAAIRPKVSFILAIAGKAAYLKKTEL